MKRLDRITVAYLPSSQDMWQNVLACAYAVASVMSDSLQPYVAHQASLSIGFSRQEHWSVLPFPSPVDHPDPGIEPRSPTVQADSLPAALPGKPSFYL